VVAVCGRLALSPEELSDAGIARAYPLSALEPDVPRSIANAGPLLERAATALAHDWLA
jgi:glycerate kinase